MARKADWIIGGIFGASLTVVLLVSGLLVVALLTDEQSDFSYRSLRRVALVEIKGAITGSENTVKQLIRYREDPTVRAIVLRVDSPGGVVAPTQEIFDEIRKTREAGKIIVASMGSVAASGGYYIACAADSILANPGTITGSIGVIFELPNAEGLFDKIGVDWNVVKSGKHKDIGSFSRDMTDEERGLMQSVVDDVYDQFVDVVAQYRPLTREEVLELADGRVFTGSQAQRLGLVDRIGTYEDSIELAARMSGITGRPDILKEREKTIFDVLMDNLETLSQVPASGSVEYRLR